MASASKIREVVRSYLSGAIDIQKFAECFENQYSEVNRASDPEAIALGDRIQAFLGRVSAGYSSERDLLAWLIPVSREPISVNIIIGMPAFPTSVNRLVEEEQFPVAPTQRNQGR